MIGVETRHGFKTLELHEADLAGLDFRVDVLVLSAFAGDYLPTPGSVVHALETRFDLVIGAEASAPWLDMRSALGVWVSRELSTSDRIARLLGVELLGTRMEFKESLENLFAALALIEAKGVSVDTVALPLLGTGAQMFDAGQVVRELVPRARGYLERSASTTRLAFVEIDPTKAGLVSDGLDAALGRERVTLPQEQVVAALRQDIHNQIQTLNQLFATAEHTRSEWLGLLSEPTIRSVEFGIAARKLVELFVGLMGAREGPLANRIRALETKGVLAPWLCAYMHVLRQLGNEAAHENVSGSKRVPRVLSAADLVAGLVCVRRLLDSWDELSEVISEVDV